MELLRINCTTIALGSEVRDSKEVLGTSLVIAILMVLIDYLIVVVLGSELFDKTSLAKIVLISTALYWVL